VYGCRVEGRRLKYSNSLNPCGENTARHKMRPNESVEHFQKRNTIRLADRVVAIAFAPLENEKDGKGEGNTDEGMSAHHNVCRSMETDALVVGVLRTNKKTKRKQAVAQGITLQKTPCRRSFQKTELRWLRSLGHSTLGFAYLLRLAQRVGHRSQRSPCPDRVYSRLFLLLLLLPPQGGLGLLVHPPSRSLFPTGQAVPRRYENVQKEGQLLEKT